MITLAPISKNIQRTLRQKIAMLKKGTGGQVYDKKKDDWVDGNYAFNMPLSTEGKPSISQNYMFARTPWLRMTSFTPMQGTNNTAVVIMGGEVGLSEKIQNIMGTVNNEKDGISTEISTEISTRKTLSGFKDLYRKSGNIPYRPIAGVKDISIEYKGGGMKLGATRTGEINWTCWDWEQLDRLTPHFLHPGKTVLLEWGWSGIGDLKNPQSYPLFNDGTLNFDDDKLDKLTEKLLTHIQSQNGHYDAMLGKIQNFDWSVNENGGFDCNTTMISPGVSMLQVNENKFKTLRDAALSELFVNNEHWYGDTITITKDEKSTSMKVLASYVTFGDYMDHFYKQIKSLTGHTGRSSNDQRIIKNENGELVWVIKQSRLSGQLSGASNSTTYRKLNEDEISDFEQSILLKDFNYEVIKLKKYTFNKLKLKYVDGEIQKTKDDPNTANSSAYFVTWGWFEDNVISKFFSSVSTSNKKVIGEIRSIDPQLDETGRIKTKDGKIVYEYIKFTDSSFLITTDANKWMIPKKNDPVFGNMINTIDDEQDLQAFKKEKTISGGKVGVEIRKIYFNVMWLQNKLNKASELKSVIDIVWSEFAAEYGGIYKFNLDIDNENNRLMVREEGYENNDTKSDEIFEFPVWEDGSIVKSQTINAKLPDRMKIAAMYGSSQIGDDKKTDGEDYITLASRAWGKLSSPADPEGEDSAAESATKRFADLYDGELDIPYRGNRNFGVMNADIQTPIYVGEIGGSSHEDGIIIYSGIKDSLTDSGKETFKADINAELDDIDATTIDEIKLIQAEYVRLFMLEYNKLAESIANSNTDLPVPDWNIFYTLNSTGSPKLKKSILFSIQKKIKNDVGTKIRPLIPIEFELEIDGTGGMFPGNSFHSSYLAQRYKEEAVFQMVGVGHKIDSSGWTTSIKGQIRAKSINNIKDKKLAEEKSKQLLKNQDKAQEKALIMGEAGYKLPPGLVTWAENRQNEPFSIIYKGEKSFVDDSGKLTFTVDGAPLDTDAMSSSGLDDMIPSTFGSGTNYFGSISQMAKELGVEQSVIEDNLKSRYNWNGVAKNVQAGWTFPR